MQWIHKIQGPEDLKKIPLEKLPEVAAEYREYLIACVSKTGGHLGASLGALELNIALHYVLESPKDKICWDVGHQAYVHKMITGRRDRMLTLRKQDGLSGFPSCFESEHDPFLVGHAGTAISQALGLAAARDHLKEDRRVVAVVGDGAMTAGLSFEALNNAGAMKKEMLVVLNDNKMAIARNVGAISKYLNKVLTNPIYNRVRSEVDKQLHKFPRLRKFAASSLEGMKHLFVPGILFEELGFRYFGPVDGHDVIGLVNTLRQIFPLKTCGLLHIITEKGYGCDFAENDSEKLHGVTPFDVRTGEKIKNGKDAERAKHEGISYTQAFVNSLLKVAAKEPRIVAVTAAMPTGTGLDQFQAAYPDRFYDVGIAEQHAVTFSGALAKGGLIPVCAVYSTFLQRAYDSVIHDVALQKQKIILALDRAGLVGADGATHNGMFDISYLGHIPDVVIGAPVNEFEMDRMMELAVQYPHVFSIRYPRGNVATFCNRFPRKPFEIGQGEVVREGEDAAILVLGSLTEMACQAAELLVREFNLNVRVVNMRFAKPLDGRLILESLEKCGSLYTLEEHALSGGFGSRVLEFLESQSVRDARVYRFGLPDQFVEHGDRDLLLDRFGISAGKIALKIAENAYHRKAGTSASLSTGA